MAKILKSQLEQENKTLRELVKKLRNDPRIYRYGFRENYVAIGKPVTLDTRDLRDAIDNAVCNAFDGRTGLQVISVDLDLLPGITEILVDIDYSEQDGTHVDKFWHVKKLTKEEADLLVNL